MIHLSFMPGVALSVAATTLVGQDIGGGDPQGAARAGYNALKLAIAYMGLMGLTFLVGGGLIATGFNRDPEVVRVARRLFVWAAAFQMFDATGMVSGGILRGAGDTRYPMVASVVCAWLVFVPLIWLLGQRLGWGAEGSWAGATIYIIVVGLVLFARVRSGRWKSYSVTKGDATAVEAATAPRR
jgi:MATE family multidrug resistance protein